MGISISFVTGEVADWSWMSGPSGRPRIGVGAVSWMWGLSQRHPTIKAVSALQSASHQWELWSIEPDMQPFELLEYRRPDTDEGYRQFREMVDEKYGPIPNTIYTEE